MQTPPIPPDEELRQAHVHASGILQLAGDKALRALVARAAAAFDMPIAAISIIDRDRQFFPASVGIDVKETPRDVSFCAHGVGDYPNLFCVPDATLDPRFVDHPAVTGPMQVRFYAGVPLSRGDDQALGMLCVVDTQPRPAFGPDEEAKLRDLARECMETLAAIRSVDEFGPEAVEQIIEQIRKAALANDEALLTELDRILQTLEREMAPRSAGRVSRLRPIMPPLADLISF